MQENNVYEFDCSKERTQTSKVHVVVKGVNVGLLHPKYEMELFKLDTKRLEIHFETWYDHMQFGVKMQSTTMSDMTGYPYT